MQAMNGAKHPRRGRPMRGRGRGTGNRHRQRRSGPRDRPGLSRASPVRVLKEGLERRPVRIRIGQDEAKARCRRWLKRGCQPGDGRQRGIWRRRGRSLALHRDGSGARQPGVAGGCLAGQRRQGRAGRGCQESQAVPVENLVEPPGRRQGGGKQAQSGQGRLPGLAGIQRTAAGLQILGCDPGRRLEPEGRRRKARRLGRRQGRRERRHQAAGRITRTQRRRRREGVRENGAGGWRGEAGFGHNHDELAAVKGPGGATKFRGRRTSGCCQSEQGLHGCGRFLRRRRRIGGGGRGFRQDE